MFKNLQFYQKVIVLLWLGFGAGNFAQAATDCNQVTEIPVSECQSLLEFYNSTNGANWTNKTGWNQTNAPCSWFGVSCIGGQVQELRLDANNLIGILPNLNLPNLQQLSFDNNQLSGSIPNFNLPHLRGLTLSLNQLSGSIPNFNFPNLWYLNLSSNQLNGNIPNFTNLPSLGQLYLNNNQLSGSIPNFTNLPNLQNLYLYSNQLSGSIPNFTSFNLANLKEAYFDNNCGLTAYDAAQEIILNQKDSKWKTRNPNCPVIRMLTLNKTGSGSIGGGGSLTGGTTVYLSATPDAGWMFDGWSPSPCNASFQMPATDLSCTAKFSPLIKTLSLSKTGNGQISGGGNFTVGSPVNLNAIPDEGWRFGGWSPSPCNSSFQMPATDLSCAADFVQIIGDLQFKSERCPVSQLETFKSCYEEIVFPIGSKVKITLNNNIITNRFEPLDLWTVLKLPINEIFNGELMFRVSNPLKLFEPYQPPKYNGEPFLVNIQSASREDSILEFEVPLHFSGKYIFYALYVTKGKNPLLDGERVWVSNLAMKEITLTDK